MHGADVATIVCCGMCSDTRRKRSEMAMSLISNRRLDRPTLERREICWYVIIDDFFRARCYYRP
jgi:hypothetical protein